MSGGTPTALVFGLDEATLARVRVELEPSFSVLAKAEPDAATLVACHVVVLAEAGPAGETAWREQLAALHALRPDLAAVLVTPEPRSLWVSGALRNRRLSQAVGSDFAAGELLASCLAANELGILRQEVSEQRRLSQQRLEVMATLGEVTASTADLGSFAEVLEVVTRELHRVIRFDMVAILIALEGSGGILHLHCQEACDASLLRAVRDRCLESFRASTGRSVDEDLLTVNLTGRPLLTAGQASRLPTTTQVPLVSNGNPIGLMFLCSPLPDPVSTEERRVLYLLANRTADALLRLKLRLGDERRRLAMMVESMADGLILTDLNSDVVLINPAGRRLLGIEGVQPVTQQFLKQTLGFYPFDLVSPGDSTGAPLREEVRVKDKTLHSMVSPVRDANGKLEGVVVVLRDFTEAKALARRQAEFVSAVSHELRSPLTTITGALDIVLSEYAGRLTDKQRRYTQLARESCTKLNQIVDDFLDVARSERGRIAMNLTPILLDELGREVVERFRGPAQARKIRLLTNTEGQNGGGMRIIGDPDRLTQVLNNLLSNAVKFTPEGGLIEVEMFGPSVASSHVGVSVYNNGAPIPDDARERIFEKFERLEGSERQVGGTGLGLAISRAIIEAHGGRIWLESPADGTKFVFTLPSAPDAGEADVTGPKEVDLAASSEPVAGATVVLVDDDAYSGYILKGILMGAGHEVLVTANTEDALQVARARRPSLVVLSASLADDFMAVLRIVKHDPETRKSAVIVMSSGDDREELLRMGADEVVAKPIQPAQFRELCARLIAEAGRARAYRILVVDDDPSIRTICREVLEASSYTVREASSGQQARSEVHRFKPDLVMLDVMMPGLDGFQTAEGLRSEPATSMIPIIFLSAKGETADKVRAFRLGAEDYVVKPFIAAELVARVRKALERRERELGASPTTQLPGAGAIESEIERRLQIGREPVAFCYLDLDNLKAFNDYYGYAKADAIIRQTADILRDVIARIGTPGDFIGHIAGDDFVFITAETVVDEVCSNLASAFDRLIPLYYNKADRERGYIEAKDRFGVLRRFPIMSISLCAVTASGGQGKGIKSYSSLAAAAAVGKKLAKGIEGSSYVRDGNPVVGELPPIALDGSEVVA
ncbi:MAG TPA: response regulator [Kofleriaceae bacterium]|nr:response regulator [Kofleriaceae bacterium]